MIEITKIYHVKGPRDLAGAHVSNDYGQKGRRDRMGFTVEQCCELRDWFLLNFPVGVDPQEHDNEQWKDGNFHETPEVNLVSCPPELNGVKCEALP